MDRKVSVVFCCEGFADEGSCNKWGEGRREFGDAKNVEGVELGNFSAEESYEEGKSC